MADGTLVATPDLLPDDLVPSLLAASDVLGTGWFGAVAAEAGPGKTVAVVGDAPRSRNDTYTHVMPALSAEAVRTVADLFQNPSLLALPQPRTLCDEA